MSEDPKMGMRAGLYGPNPKTMLREAFARPAIRAVAVFDSGIIVPDISFYQDLDSTPGKVNFGKMRQAGARGVIIRVGQGAWIDEDFPDYWRDARSEGLPRGSYWFWDSRYSPDEQADRWANALAPDPGEMEDWGDFEENYGGKWGGWRNFRSMMQLKISFLPGAVNGVYSGYYYWLSKGPPASDTAAMQFFGAMPLFLAWYTTNPANVKKPPPWNKALLWQKTSTGPGLDFGVESLGIDLSDFQGSQEQFDTRYNQETPPEEDMLPELRQLAVEGEAAAETAKNKHRAIIDKIDGAAPPVEKMQVRAGVSLNTRTGPGLNYPIIPGAALSGGMVITILERVTNPDTSIWVHRDAGWNCQRGAGGTVYLDPFPA